MPILLHFVTYFKLLLVFLSERTARWLNFIKEKTIQNRLVLTNRKLGEKN